VRGRIAAQPRRGDLAAARRRELPREENTCRCFSLHEQEGGLWSFDIAREFSFRSCGECPVCFNFRERHAIRSHPGVTDTGRCERSRFQTKPGVGRIEATSRRRFGERVHARELPAFGSVLRASACVLERFCLLVKQRTWITAWFAEFGAGAVPAAADDGAAINASDASTPRPTTTARVPILPIDMRTPCCSCPRRRNLLHPSSLGLPPPLWALTLRSLAPPRGLRHKHG